MCSVGRKEKNKNDEIFGVQLLSSWLNCRGRPVNLTSQVSRRGQTRVSRFDGRGQGASFILFGMCPRALDLREMCSWLVGTKADACPLQFPAACNLRRSCLVTEGAQANPEGTPPYPS